MMIGDGSLCKLHYADRESDHAPSCEYFTVNSKLQLKLVHSISLNYNIKVILATLSLDPLNGFPNFIIVKDWC